MTPAQEIVQQAPRIRKYSNILLFLKDVYDFRKYRDADFSYEIWSAELGFKSRSFMYLVCSGRRPLTPKFIETLSRSFKFGSAEKNHLTLLANVHRTKSTDLKKIFSDKILENLECAEKTMKPADYAEFVLSPTMPLIMMILAFRDTAGVISEICQLLSIDEAKVVDDLDRLHKLGLLKRTSDVSGISSQSFSGTSSRWIPVTCAFSVPDDPTNTIMDDFHLRILREAARKSQSSNAFKRFRSTVFAIEEKHDEELKEEIEIFITKMKNKFGCDELDNKRLVRLNLQAYPVTEIFKKK